MNGPRAKPTEPPRCSAHTLAPWYGQDRLIPPALAQRFVADIPGARLQVFDALGKVPKVEDPARTAAAVKAFLGSLPGR